MKKLSLIFIVIIFITACAKVSPDSGTLQKEGEVIPDLEEIIEPFAIVIKSDNLTAELILETKISCIVSGGKKPYFYSWWTNDSQISIDHCDAKDCIIQIDLIGDSEIGCYVSDSSSNYMDESLILSVTKEKIKIKAIVGLGDSLLEGFGLEDQEMNWISQFARNFETAQLYNYAVSGATSHSVKDYQMKLFSENISDENKIVFIWFGANDIIYFTDINEFRANYESIIREINSIPNTEMVLITIPDASKLPIATELDLIMKEFGINVALMNITKDMINSYNGVIFDIGRANDLLVIDMFTYMETFDDQYITSDQFHPNEKGHELIAEKISKELDILYPNTEFY